MKNILILSANPINTDKLRLDEEVREIRAALERAQNREAFKLIPIGAVRIDDLRQMLLDNNPQIVHFSGHGTGTDGLILENTSGNMQIVSTASLSDLFELFKEHVECVLLNACYSEIQAEAIYRHINCVIGMACAVTDQAAINFSQAFYDALGAGRNYKDAFEFGRNNIDINGIPESLTPKIKIRNNSKTLFSKKQSTTESMKQKPSQSLTISNGQFSGVQIGQAIGNITQAQQNTQSTAEKQLTPTQVVELIAQIESLFLNSNLSDVSKKQALKHLDYAKDAVQEEQPDKNVAARSLQKATQVLKEANETLDVDPGFWQNLEPIAKQLAPWLGIAAKSLI